MNVRGESLLLRRGWARRASSAPALPSPTHVDFFTLDRRVVTHEVARACVGMT